MGKKLKGSAKIELKNVNSGNTKVQIENNMITNAMANIFGNNPFGVITNGLAAEPSMLMGGLVLFGDTIEEDVNNTILPGNPISWAGYGVNPGSCLNRGSIDITETTYSDDGVKFVWNFTTAQGNGNYKSLCLGNPFILNFDNIGGSSTDEIYKTSMFSNYNVYNVPKLYDFSPQSSTTSTDDYKPLVTTYPDYIDEANSKWYKFDVLDDGMSVNVIRITKHITSKFLNEAPCKGYSNTTGKPGFNYEMVNVSLPICMRHTGSASTKRDIYSVEYYNGYIYLIWCHENSGKMDIVKLKLDTLFSSNPVTESSSLTFNNAYFYNGGKNVGSGYNRLQQYKKGNVGFKFPYVYANTKITEGGSTVNKLYGYNITDQTDVKMPDGQDLYSSRYNSYTEPNYVEEYLTLGDVVYCTTCCALDTKANKIVYNSMLRYYSVNLAGYSYGSSYLTMHSICNNSYITCGSVIVSNPYYIATINNITPFTKSSADTMKITYTITQQ